MSIKSPKSPVKEGSSGSKASIKRNSNFQASNIQLLLKTESTDSSNQAKKKSVLFNEQNTYNEESTAETNVLENIVLSNVKKAPIPNKNSVLFDFWYTEARNFVKNVTIFKAIDFLVFFILIFLN
jgi:hypothetical protein